MGKGTGGGRGERVMVEVGWVEGGGEGRSGKGGEGEKEVKWMGWGEMG